MQVTNHLEHVLLVFRGDVDGSFKGAQAQRFVRILDDQGNELDRRLAAIQSIGELAATGFTWPDVCASINAGLLLSHEQQEAQIAALTEQRNATAQTLLQVEQQRDSAQADAAALREQIAALQAQPQVRYIKKWQLTAGMRKDDPSGVLLAAFNAVIASLPPAIKELWDGSAGVEEDSPFLTLAKAPPMGLTDAQILSMFDRYPKITQADVLAMVQGGAQ